MNKPAVTTSVIGFDSAWTDQVRAPGAIALIRVHADGTRSFVPPRLVRFAGALEAIAAEAAISARRFVALDQPTIVPNLTGARPVDRVAASVISWVGGGVQPANRSKIGMFDDAAPIWAFKRELKASDDGRAARAAVSGLFIAEVFPALALPSLDAGFCGRKLRPCYNPERRKTFRLEDWHRVLAVVESTARALDLNEVAGWCRHHAGDDPARRPGKGEQDLLDAVICALIGYIWLYAPAERSMMIGDLERGYMITPAAGEARARLEAKARSLQVPII